MSWHKKSDTLQVAFFISRYPELTPLFSLYLMNYFLSRRVLLP